MNFTFLKKTFKQQAGFSLTEVIVGGGILAGVGLAGAMLFKDQKMAQKKIDNEQTLNVYHQSLMRSLNNPFNCNATFKALGKIGSGQINAGTELPALYTCNDPSPGSVTPGPCEDFKKGASGISSWNNLIAKDQFIDNTDLWQVNHIYVKDNVSTSGPLKLKIEYVLNKNKFPGKPAVTKEIFLSVRYTSGGVFSECLNSQESSVNNLQNDICKSMSAVTSTGSVVATWDEATQSCKTNGTTGSMLKQCSDPAMVVEGIRSDGSVHCKYPQTGVNCTIPGQVPKLKMSGGKMKVVCE